MPALNPPHGERLIECYLPIDSLPSAKAEATLCASWVLNERQLCDIELILDGSFSPLTGFLGRDDYESVLTNMRLTNGLLWPIPITLDVSEAFAAELIPGRSIALRDPEGVLIALLDIDDIWEPDRHAEAQAVFATTDDSHPGVAYLLHRSGPVYLGGRLRGIQPPRHYDFVAERKTPRQLRTQFTAQGWNRIVAFQTRNPMHRAHMELTLRAARQAEANLLINPVVGMTKPGDIDHYSRVRCYEHLLKYYPTHSTTLSLLGLAMRMAGPREAVWHMIIRKNLGCSHFIVGRDHAGPGKNRKGIDFYPPYAAQELALRHTDELGITILPFEEVVYLEKRDEYVPISEVQPSDTVLNISGTEVRQRLQTGADIPNWFSYPEVVAELRKTYPPRHEQGFVVFFTGLSGAGKSTLANALQIKLLELGGRRTTMLDGDHVRQMLSSELGFSKEHRDLNILRIGYVASEIAKHGGIAICAPIAPYEAMRARVRELVTQAGAGMIEVHVSTSLEVCEQRDRKGLYAKARAGLIKEFTGISDPYQIPANPELSIDTAEVSVEEATQSIILKLKSLGYLT